MPDYNGIHISLISQWELKVHPEFPHPDSSQFTFRSPVSKRLKHDEECAGELKPLVKSDSKADRLLGRQSCVSVYVPSLPGSRFWIEYKITETALVHSEWYFFKLLMNGRHIASWGTNARTKPYGQVMRGLFEPSERWDYKYEGILHKNMGTESRSFYFSNAEEIKSAANDGGLIEVLVFRARGRSRALAHPEGFKSQEHYGIFMPSGGLLDQPQDAKFYDWHLADPKDSPYAVFNYHYRSWDSLQSQQLIPANHPRQLLSPSRGLDSSCPIHQSRNLRAKLGRDSNDEQNQFVGLGSQLNSDPDDLIQGIDSINSVSFSSPSLSLVLDDNTKHGPGKGDLQDGISTTLTCHPKHEVPISKFSNSTTNQIETAVALSQSASNQTCNRPLPKVRGPVLSRNDFEHSRTSSGASNSVSITSSLIQSLNRDLTSPEPEIGLATAVSIPRRTSIGFTSTIFNHISPVKESQDTDPKSSSTSPGMEKNIDLGHQGAVFNSAPLCHANSLPDAAKNTPGKHKPFLARRLLLHVSKNRLKPSTQSHTMTEPKVDSMPSMEVEEATLSPSPAEWMFRIPSPVRQQAPHANCEQTWSSKSEEEPEKFRTAEYDETWSPTPQSGKRGQRCRYNSTLRKKATRSNDHSRSMSEEIDRKPSLEPTDIPRVSPGWI